MDTFFPKEEDLNESGMWLTLRRSSSDGCLQG